MMKTKRFCKSTVSLLLVFMMLVSMLTVGIVSTSAAEADVATTGDYTELNLEGSFNDWANSNDRFDSSGSVTVDIDPGTYTFRLRYATGTNAGRCYSSSGSFTDTTDEQILHYTTNETCTFIASGGTYTFTITERDDDCFKLVVTRSGGDTKWWLRGTLTNWDPGVESDEDGKVTLELDEGEYTFKAFYSNQWYGINDTITNSGYKTFSTTGTDCTFKATKNGTYVFEFDTNTKVMTVTAQVTYAATVDFTYDLNEQTGELTVTPTSTFIEEGTSTTVTPSSVKYTITYIKEGGSEVTTSEFTDYMIITLEPNYEYSVKVNVTGTIDSKTVSATSESKPFIFYSGETPNVTIKVALKSSSSYRYIPSVTVNGTTTYEMTCEAADDNDIDSDDYIGHNVNGTQSYWWYWKEFEIPAGSDVTLKFTNEYNTAGSTYTILAANIKRGASYKFGYDNLNYSNAVTLYDPTVDTDAVINFYETATHMVQTDTESVALAMTRVNNESYYMGDADLDGNLSIMDATTVQLALAKRIELSDVAEQIADYSTDNVLSIYDVTIIQKKLAN